MSQFEMKFQNVCESPVKQYTVSEFSDILEYSKYKQMEKDPSLLVIKSIPSTIKQNEDQTKKLSQEAQQVAQDLWLNADCWVTLKDFTERLRKLANCYKAVIEEFSSMLDKWSELRRQNIQNLQNSTRTFQSMKRTTMVMSLISSTMEFALGIGTLLHRYLHHKWNPKYHLIAVSVVGGVSITGSLLALSYSKQVTEDILKNMREEKYVMRDLEMIYRRGNWIDKDVEDLFPYGIDLDLVNEIVLDVNKNFMDEKSLMQKISAAIIMSNIKKDNHLINDEKFLSSVKAFVESPAAQMWFSRIKLRHLLDDMNSRLTNLPDRRNRFGNEVFLNSAALNLYPVFFPLFVDSGDMDKIRFICSSMIAITAAFNWGTSKDNDFEEMRRTSVTLMNDYEHIKCISEDIVNEYD